MAFERVIQRLPRVRELEATLARQRLEIDALLNQRNLLETDRDELAGHCQRLNKEVAESLQRKSKLEAEAHALLASRDQLERERNELAGHCNRMERELAEGLEREALLKSKCQRLSDFVEQLRHCQSESFLLEKMRAEWDERARANALHYTNTAEAEWDAETYFATGEANVREHIANDMENICQAADPASMRVLEIGCGAGRMTKPLARLFGEVHAVDISEEMIRIARQQLADVPNAFFYHNNGSDLAGLAGPFDFAFSFIVFQHIPSRAIIETYLREVHRLLRPGHLFKFQVQGSQAPPEDPADTWLGAGFTVEEATALATRCGFELRHVHGAETQYMWLWFFRRP